ncbi:MAG: type I DNA topoisomerase [Firmicutes bacterium]|nr:type I DNA topoisomerase [Bacillota bacterium]
MAKESEKKKTASKKKPTKKNLLIVESPAKAATIKKYLGSNYNVTASMGHVIDLPKSSMAIDIENDFEPKYITIRGKGELLASLKSEAKKSNKVYLATDPDREGEAISWHLAQALNIDPASECRVTFNEVTKTAVKEAIKKPREIDMNLVDAQQARRVLDRIVGYSISPILWEKVKRGLSAGRVQSVATRMICEREDEIVNFTPKEYWTIDAELAVKNRAFSARYFGKIKDGKVSEAELGSADEAQRIVSELKSAKSISVASVKTAQKQRNPKPPFTTSTMQQDASRRYGYQAARTMQIAQTLYEGINLGGSLGTVGLITYMRTDSLRIADDAQKEAVEYLAEHYGAEYVRAKQYKTKKSAQDAHEAIRPTSINIVPADIRDKLTDDQYKLYRLIWERFAASQMTPAVYDTVQVSAAADDNILRASSSAVSFKGYMAVYVESSETKEEKSKALPKLEDNMPLTLKDTDAKQHFTQPPARYSDATLIQELEEKGIGRPSTYAPTISTIVSRGYVARNKRQLIPTELGTITTDIMKKNFKDIVDTDFTANMENELDEIEEGEREWKSVIREFYAPFEETLEQAKTNIEKIKIKDEESDVICDKCGRKMVYKISKYGKFLACPGFPECRNTKTIRRGTGVECPKCGGEILIKTSKRGKTYYGCENSPKCDYIMWYRPLKEKCPVCGGVLMKKNGKNPTVVCANEDCTYTRKADKDEDGED